MSTLATVNTFSQDLARRARYWYERLPYTAGPMSVPAGWSTVFNVNGINATRAPRWMARLHSIAATQNANVAFDYGYDKQRLPALADNGFADALPAGLRAARAMSLSALDRLQLRVNNTSGAPIAGYQLNYMVTMQRLSLAEKLLLGIEDYTPEETEALSKTDVADQVDKGIAPIPRIAQLERTYENRVLQRITQTLHVDVLPTDQSFLTVRAGEAGPDTFTVLREIAVEGAVAVTVSVDRDDDANYVGVSGAAFVDGDDAPWSMFLPSLDYLTFHVQGAGPASAVPIRISYDQVKLSNLLRVKFGLAGKGDVPDHTYWRAIAGVA